MQDIALVDYEATCAAGTGLKALRAALVEGCSGLSSNTLAHSDLPTWVGSVKVLDNYVWPASDVEWQSRNNALIDLALQQGSLLASLERLKQQFGPTRIGIVMGSSTSSIDRTEAAYRELDAEGHLPEEYLQENVFNPHAPGLYLAHRLGLDGPNITINTACSSSAKVFATGARWLRTGLVDAVLVGGADSLCLSVLQGFHALQLVSTQPCRPFDGERNGINLGEAAGFALLVRTGETDHLPIGLSGYGESSDAHHMSHPHPEGEGARLAIEQALSRARLQAADIGYINLHGTASRANDHIEGNLVARLFGPAIPASSTKGWTGHTLGAAGILEALIAIDALRTGRVPGNLNLQHADPDIALALSTENRQLDLHHVMSNSFGFGGNNACLIFSKLANHTPSTDSVPTSAPLRCRLVGLGTIGPGFSDWPALRELLAQSENSDLPSMVNPSPQVIPANERRRAPLPVKMAVEVSWQALQHAGLAASDVACVFGSGLGDTEITDYMCRELTTELKQLSPTKFHNSVHNAAAGYWTISSGCMKSANSIAAYKETTALALLEGVIQCVQQNEPVLVTLFDIPAHASYRQIFACDQPFAAALLLCPESYPATGPLLHLNPDAGASTPRPLSHAGLQALAATNPSAQVLELLALLTPAPARNTTTLALSAGRYLSLDISA